MKISGVFTKLIFLASFLCFTTLVSTAQNKKISIQGFLKDGNSKAVDNGVYELTFKLYTVATGGTAIWTETNSAVNVYGGVYSVQLGAITSISTLKFEAPYFLGVTIQGTELTPRMELTYSPYALAVNTVVCSGALGDVKYSILNPTQFATVNGACWVPMDGSSMAGSALATLTSNTTLPNGGGLFIRAQDNANSNNDPDRTFSSSIATVQQDDNKPHNHTGTTGANGDHNHAITDPGHEHDWGFGLERDDSGSGTSYNEFTRVGGTTTDAIKSAKTGITINNAGSHSHTVTINNSSGTESRPKNMNFYVYIRIN